MKSLNDALRDDFGKELLSKEILERIELYSLDQSLITKAFDVLLKFKSNPDLVDKARAEFENFVINQLRSNSF